GFHRAAGPPSLSIWLRPLGARPRQDMTRHSIDHVSNRPSSHNGHMTRATAPAIRLHAGWAVTSVIVGLLTGVATLAGQAVLPIEANRLANSGAIWVTVAFAVGWITPSGPSAT